MKKMALFSFIIIVMISVFMISCNEEPAELSISGDATLKSLTIDGTKIDFGEPSDRQNDVRNSILNLTEAQAVTGVNLVPVTSSKKAKADYRVFTLIGPSKHPWRGTEVSSEPFEHGETMIIRITAENNTMLHYGFTVNIYSSEPGSEIRPGNQDALAGKLLILQAYGSTSNANGTNRSFIELYNNTDNDVNLNGITLYFADGTTVSSGTNNNTEDGEWKSIPLYGTVPAKASFLILGQKQNLNLPNGTGSGNFPRFAIEDSEGDLNENTFVLNDRAFKAALIRSNGNLLAPNPFDMDGTGAKALGYVDMIGSATDNNGRDKIFGFETQPARSSSTEAARRRTLTDNNNNSTDFARIDYTKWTTSSPNGITDEQLRMFRPKNTAYGRWNPYAETDATLHTLTIAGRDKTLGAHTTAITAPNSPVLLTETEAQAGVVITFTTTSAKASAKYAITNTLPGASLTWKNSGDPTPAVADGNFLIVRVTAEDERDILYYVYNFDITTENNVIEVEAGAPDSLAGGGKLVILQAYGTGPLSGAAATGATHSFIELYNTTNTSINLNGITLYYADGGASADGEWKTIELPNRSVTPRSSFLILGARQNSSAKLKFTDNYGDLNNANLILSNTYFKAALIRNNATLTMPNPFNMNGEGATAQGYIDMVGTGVKDVTIRGYEGEPARNSTAESVRRRSLVDSNNNKEDFASIDYPSADAEQLEIYTPKKVAEDEWDPFPPILIPGDEIEAGADDPLAGKLFILQVYGSPNAASASNSFVELYNKSGSPINLNGIGLYYANGKRIANVGDPAITADENWSRIGLNGTIPAGGSFLILGTRHQTPTGTGLNLNNNYGDMYVEALNLSNRSFKVALIRNTRALTVPNPFNMGPGQRAQGYIDMVGARNDPEDARPDQIFGFETEPARNSASQAVRRRDDSDRNNNAADFIAARYSDMTAAEREIRRPKNVARGAWDPFEIPQVIVLPGENKLLILHVGTYHATNSDTISHCFVELYNAGETAVDLTNYSLAVAASRTGGTDDGPWTQLFFDTLWGNKIIQPGHSFLIRGAARPGGGPIAIPYGDLESTSLQIHNRGAKVLLLNAKTPIAQLMPTNSLSGNPFNPKVAGYVDMLGGVNTLNQDYVSGFETAVRSNLSGSQTLRRKSITDTDNNSIDFENVDFRTAMSTADKTLKTPKNHTAGRWDPFAATVVMEAKMLSLKVGNAAASSIGTPGATWDTAAAGAVTVTSLLANDALIEPVLSEDATFRVAKVSGSGAPSFEATNTLTFINGDTLYIEVTSFDNRARNIYKIAVNVQTAAGTPVNISGTYTITTTSAFPPANVVINAYSNQGATTLVSSTNATINAVTPKTGTWAMQVLSGQAVYFKIVVTDSTGLTYGANKNILNNAPQTYNGNTQNIALTLSGFTAPALTSFRLNNATRGSGAAIANKDGIINDSTGVISFTKTSFARLVEGNQDASYSYSTYGRTPPEDKTTPAIIRFDKLTATFQVSSGSKLFVGNTEQVSGSSGTTNNYYNEVVFTVVGEDNARKTYRVPAPKGFTGSSQTDDDLFRVVGTRSWQTMGFGTMDITSNVPFNDGSTVPWSPAYPERMLSKLNNVWLPGSYTYISPEGRVVEGATEVRYRGNGTYRNDRYKSYNLKLGSPASFDYFDWKNDKYIQLPANNRWVLLAHPKDDTRIRGAMGWEMGRHVLKNMGWQPHADWVVLFVNGEYKGIYILVEPIRQDASRLNTVPAASKTNLDGGFIAEINTLYWYFNEWYEHGSHYLFDELWSYMTSNLMSMGNLYGGGWKNVNQGVVFSLQQPDGDLGWYEPDPPSGSANWYSNSQFPRRGFILQGKLSGSRSLPTAQWVVPTANIIGEPGMVDWSPNGTGLSTWNSRTVESAFQTSSNKTVASLDQSAFIKIAERLQKAEDAIFNREGFNTGVGGWYDVVDYQSMIDWHIAMELTMNWEVLLLNGQYIHRPAGGKLKMGPIWDLDQGWSSDYRGISVGDIGCGPFWITRLLGRRFTSYNPASNPALANEPSVAANTDTFYTKALKARWDSVRSNLATELGTYIDKTESRFGRLLTIPGLEYGNSYQSYINTGNKGRWDINTEDGGTGIRINGNRTGLKSNISTNSSNLTTRINNLNF